MSELALLAADPGALEQYADPGKFVVQACERAKTWLQQALEHGDIDAIAETRAQADAIRIYTTQKQHGQDAVLAAQEVVRRAEAGIAAAIRRAQAQGEIPCRGQHVGAVASHVLDKNMSHRPAKEYFAGGQAQSDAYAMVDGVPAERLESALAGAKAERNLSRANVIRHIRAEASAATSPAGRPAPPAESGTARSRRPLPDAFFDAAFDLKKAVDRVVRLAEDDRFPRNADQVAAKHRSDLIRARDALAGVLEQLP